MSRLRPYANWTERDFSRVIISHVNNFEIDTELRNLWKDIIFEAMSSEHWEFIKDYNGCTLVQDPIHPSPACFVHDYMWICGYGGYHSDFIFRRLILAEGVSTRGRAFRRWLGVRIGWYAYFRWKYMFKRKLKPLTPKMVELYMYLKK